MLLKIKRVLTLVSNHQKDETAEEEEGEGCGRNILSKCCINGERLPLYTCKPAEENVTFLESVLLGEWEDRFQRGLFRYDVTACETKVIPGKYGFIAQLNEARHLKKRPTEFRVDQVLQPFDANKFNFTKVSPEELLFQFEANMPLDADNSPRVVAINVSPIEYGHVLLIPQVFDCLPQRIDHKSLLLALHMAVEAANPYFRVGYNSLSTFATINHLHFQAYYLAMPFPIEKAHSLKISTTNDGVRISKLMSYTVRGLLFEGGNSIKDLSVAVSNASVCLQNNNIPFNFLISDSGKRIFLLLQCYAEKQALGEVSSELLDTQVNPAVWEMSGHMVLKRKEDYEGASEEKAWSLLAEVSLSEERFKEVNTMIFEAIGCSGEEEEELEEESSIRVNCCT
ncbi:hypothetical protein Bca52824_051733 [Brassica carinata]|uniref:GDP-L-galactose phosphorylase n=2 Tax=Brassica TaxID=3705 RepID=A0A0D3AM09_BRAOL|nr:PREDICTED: GDP-L-galactose phosphorylase 2 [Brassica oleracea var. oleracea]KAG2280513.1 hypothetical protein Bca52824_051733 [Brassica carinata]